jgi:hypothetical protein
MRLCPLNHQLWVQIPLKQGVLHATLCDKVCQWLVDCMKYNAQRNAKFLCYKFFPSIKTRIKEPMNQGRFIQPWKLVSTNMSNFTVHVHIWFYFSWNWFFFMFHPTIWILCPFFKLSFYRYTLFGDRWHTHVFCGKLLNILPVTFSFGALHNWVFTIPYMY